MIHHVAVVHAVGIVEAGHGVDHLSTAHTSGGSVSLKVFGEEGAELSYMLDILELKVAAGLVLGVDLKSAETENLLPDGAVDGHIDNTVKLDFVLSGGEEALFDNKDFICEGIGLESKGKTQEEPSSAFLYNNVIL